MNVFSKFITYSWVLLAFFLTFCIGLIHHKWFYPLQFHGDAASMHVLAKAIFDEGSLLPKDFSYGNQLILLRSSPFIALALFMGFKGYDAFIFGSSLSIAFWGSILSVFLNFLFKSRKETILFTLCLLIPFGYWDSDYILGQQSHLSNAVLSLGALISAYKYLEEKRFSYIFLSSLCIFIIAAEAPIRGLLALAPLSVIILLLAVSLREFLVITASTLFSFFIAYFSNKYFLIHRPISVNYLEFLKFKSSSEMLDNLGRTTTETIGAVSSLNFFSGRGLSLLGGFCFLLGLILVLYYFYAAFTGLAKLTDSVKVRFGVNLTQRSPYRESGADFLHLTGTVGLIFGALAVAGLNPDSSRHYLWVIFLFKLIIINWILKGIRKIFSNKLAFFSIFALSILASTWFANLIKFDWSLNNSINSNNYSQAVQGIRLASEKTGIKNIYGEDFWRMMPLNSYIDGLNAQALLLDHVTLRPYHWLTRPSWTCTDNDVLYYLKGGVVDKVIEYNLKKSGGRRVVTGTDYAIWAGPRVWRLSPSDGCHETQLHYTGQTLASLPSMVGVLENGNRAADGRPGFLIFGPYEPFKSGSYELTVYGSSKVSNGSYIDVVSGRGTVVHARFEIVNSNGNLLLKSGTVDISENISDIEIRLWVGKGSIVNLTGYELNPKGKSSY